MYCFEGHGAEHHFIQKKRPRELAASRSGATSPSQSTSVQPTGSTTSSGTSLSKKRKKKPTSDERFQKIIDLTSSNQKFSLSILQRSRLAAKKADFPWLGYNPEGKYYFCEECSSILDSTEASKLKKHITTKKHKDAKGLQDIATVFSQPHLRLSFKEDLALHIAAHCLPKDVAQGVFSPECVGAIMGQKILYHPTYLRHKILKGSATKKRKEIIKQYVEGKFYSLILDETPRNRRKIINMLIKTSTHLLLLQTKVFRGSTLNAAAMKAFELDVIESNGLGKSLMRGHSRDNASYMARAFYDVGQITEFTSVIDVTCISHGINLVSERLCESCEEVETLFMYLRTYWLGPQRSERQSRAHALPGFLSSINSGETQWRDWLQCFMFVRENSQAILNLVTNELEAHSTTAFQKDSLNKTISLLSNDVVGIGMDTFSMFSESLMQFVTFFQGD